jgi:hypothetical protein
MQYEIMDRIQAARFLQSTFCLPTTKASLATMATRGGGPQYFTMGRYVRYRKADLVSWAAKRSSAFLDSTSSPRCKNAGLAFYYAEDSGDLEEDAFDHRNTGDAQFDEMTKLIEEDMSLDEAIDEQQQKFNYHKQFKK